MTTALLMIFMYLVGWTSHRLWVGPPGRHSHDWQETYRGNRTVTGWTYYIETCATCGETRDGIL